MWKEQCDNAAIEDRRVAIMMNTAFCGLLAMMAVQGLKGTVTGPPSSYTTNFVHSLLVTEPHV